MKTAMLSILLAVVAAACGGKKSEPAKPVEPASETTAQKHAMPAELVKFHDVLSPRWHADQGDKRMADTCAASAEFQTQADALAKTTPPANADAAKWSASAKELTEAVVALDASCQAKDATAFEPAFKRVHDGFHGLMESTSAGHHDEHHPEGGAHKM